MDSKDLAHIIQNHSRIILPDFGAFLLKESGSNTFKPEYLTFSPFLKYNDNVLEEYLAKYKGITKDDAIKQTKAFIDCIKEELRVDGYIDIPDIGKLLRDTKGAIIFTPIGKNIPTAKPDKPKVSKSTKKISEEPIRTEVSTNADVNLNTPEDLTLEIDTQQSNQNDLPNITENKETVLVNEKNIEIEGEKNIVEKLNTSITTISKKQQNFPDKHEDSKPMAKTKRKSKFTLLLIFLGVSLTVIFIFAYTIRELAFDNEYNEVQKPRKPAVKIVEATQKVENLEKTEPKDEIDKAFDQMNVNQTNESSTNQAQQSKIEEQIEKSVIENSAAQKSNIGNFYLVVGSFSDKMNAEEYVKRLKSEGFKSEVLSLSNGKNYVTVGTFTTKEDANQQKIKLIHKFPSIWVFKK